MKLKIKDWKIFKIFRRPKKIEERMRDAFLNVPKITDETITEHREDILKGARKYIYPLKHSSHYIVRISVILFVVLVVIFFIFSSVELYDLQSTSSFITDVTNVIPFPVAKVGNSWISYNSYLFELRREMHYYETQQQVNFSLKSNVNQLNNLKTQAMNQVILNYYVKSLAQKYHITVSNQEVNNEITYFQNENRLGSNPSVLNNILNDFWGWNINDFKIELKNELLQQKVVYALDHKTVNEAKSVYNQLLHGADFATLAQQYSSDISTKNNGGQYPNPIIATDRTLAPQIMAELFSLKVNQISPIINTGYTLEIIKVDAISGPSVTASHIEFILNNIHDYTSSLAKQERPHYFIKY